MQLAAIESRASHADLVKIGLSSNGWVPLQSVLMLAVVGLGVGVRGQWQSETSFLIGALLFTVAAGIGIAGVRKLGANRTARPEPKPGSELIQHGIYRHLRHPLYASVILAGFGWALLWQSAPALAAAMVQAVFFDAKARREERLLSEKFSEYAAYSAKTKRFLLWVY